MAIRLRSTNRALLRGLCAGIVAGALFTLVEVVIYAASGLSPLEPLRVIGSLVLGAAAPSSAHAVTEVSAGLGVQVLLSALYGAVLSLVLLATGGRPIPSPIYVLVAMVYSLVLWPVDFLLVALVASALFPQPAAAGPFLFGFTIAHAFYGLGLGAHLARPFRMDIAEALHEGSMLATAQQEAETSLLHAYSHVR